MASDIDSITLRPLVLYQGLDVVSWLGSLDHCGDVIKVGSMRIRLLDRRTGRHFSIPLTEAVPATFGMLVDYGSQIVEDDPHDIRVARDAIKAAWTAEERRYRAVKKLWK